MGDYIFMSRSGSFLAQDFRGRGWAGTTSLTLFNGRLSRHNCSSQSYRRVSTKTSPAVAGLCFRFNRTDGRTEQGCVMGDEVGYRNDSAFKKVFTHYPVMRSLLCSPVCPLVLSISRNQNGVLYQTSIEHSITVSRQGLLGHHFDHHSSQNTSLSSHMPFEPSPMPYSIS